MAPENPQIGTRIRLARERLMWSQQDLADATGVDVKTVRNWEKTGRIRNRQGKIEEVLGISLSNGHDDDGGSGSRPSVTYDEALDRAEEAFELLRQVARERQEGNAHETRRRRAG